MALIGGLILVVVLMFRKTLKLSLSKLQVKNQLLKHEGSNVVEVVNLQNISDEIYISFHENWFGMFENEVRAINAIKNLSLKNVRSVAVLYSATGQNMYKDFQKYLSINQYNSIKKLLQ